MVLDADTYTDVGVSNWVTAQSTSAGINYWTTEGGDYKTGSVAAQYPVMNEYYTYKQNFSSGIEDLELDVSNAVEDWIKRRAFRKLWIRRFLIC